MKIKTAKILGILISVLVLFASCGQLAGNDESKVTVNLPYVSRSARALSDEVNSRLKSEHSSYRVHMNDRVLEGTGGSFSAYFAVGLKVDVFIESLNSKGEVIVRTASRSIVVKNGENVVTLDMKADGNEVTRPTPAPQPVTGRVTYANGGDYVSGTPTDNTSYDENADVQLSATEPTRPGYKFNGWTATVELKAKDANGSNVTVNANTHFVSTSTATSGINYQIKTFEMPASGVVLTAEWTPITYTVNFNGDGATGSENQITFTVADAGSGRTFPSTTGFTKTDSKFKHWATSSNGTSILLDYIISQLKMGNTISGLTIGGNNDITIYAVWEAIPYRDLANAAVGDVICANGKVLSASDTTAELQSQTIAVVYKVDTSAKKAWAVGKVLSANTMAWATTSAEGYNKNITDLQESNYSDGSTGLGILRAAVTDADGDDLATNYPAWDYACNYGTNSTTNAGIPINMQSGWYLPCKQELEEVYDNKAAIEAALTGASKTSFGSSSYWSSSQYADNYLSAYRLSIGSGNWNSFGKNASYCVCAVRQFTW